MASVPPWAIQPLILCFLIAGSGRAPAQETRYVERLNQLAAQQSFILSEIDRLREEAAKAPALTPIDPDTLRQLPETVRNGLIYSWSKQSAMAQEAQIKLDWLTATNGQLEKLHQRLGSARNPAERVVLEKEIRLKTDLAERLTGFFLPPAAVPTTAPPPAATTPAAPAQPDTESRTQTGVFQQLRESQAGHNDDLFQKGPEWRLDWATSEFGEGRAGAGGISLHSPAAMPKSIDPASIERALVRDGRLRLVHKEGEWLLPPLDLDHLAVALRNVYGGEGKVTGALSGVEPNAVVIQTGKALFGEVVWKREFLPYPVRPEERFGVGQKVEFLLGPGIGLLSLPEPSVDRVTYYGSIQGTRMGRTMFLSDRLLFNFMTGFDAETGRLVDPSTVPGIHFGLARDIERELAETPETKPKQPAAEGDRTKWWRRSTWYVWIPDVSLDLPSGSHELRFARARMTLDVWTAGDATTPRAQDARELGVAVTKQFDELKRHYPVLGELVEVAQAVAVVRWLKAHEIPFDLEWLKQQPIAEADTPLTVRSLHISPVRNKQRKPAVEAATETRP